MADANGIVARTIAAMRYAFTGTAPAEWFGPSDPLANQAPPEVKGRTWDYPVASNLNYTPRKTEPVSFTKLKLLANNCGPLKLVMGRQRDLVKAIEWSIKPRAKQAKDAVADPTVADPTIAEITAFLEMPDKVHDWSQWINAALDQIFVLDALSIYPRRTLGGDLYSLDLIDGATITPLIDASGRRPMAPTEAYQQILKGLPAVGYTTEELIYYPENYRADKIYGYSRVEMLVDEVETMIGRLKSQKGFLENGNIGRGYMEAPEGFNPDQIAALETHWNAMMSADGGRRLADQNQIIWVPHGTAFHETKINIFDPLFDEWLIRLICFLFDVAPTPFLKQAGLGHGSAGTDKEASEEGGIAQLKQMVRRLMNRVLADQFKRPDLEFAWIEDNEPDPKAAAEIANIRLRNGSTTINEVRDRNGEESIEGGDTPLIYTASGATPLDLILNPPPPAPVPAALGGLALDDGTKPAAANDDAPGKAALAKSVTPETRLTSAIAAYLAARANEITPKLVAALGLEKSAPSDGYSGRIDDAFDEVDWDWTPLAAEVEPILASIAVARGTAAATDHGLFDKATLKTLMQTTNDYAEARAAEMVGMTVVDGALVENADAAWSIQDATRNMLRGAIEEALDEGKSNQELAKVIRESTGFSKARAETIARTETAKAQVAGTVAGWKASGVVAGKQFAAAPDCCDECQELDGEIVGLDEEFAEGDPPVHPQCRCGILAVLPEDMPDADGVETED
ncbi:hypothetical protein GCM10008023_05880 [Sphingomonas glacialis]|uniref:Phage head morphogenesis domain-containing protein n=1 Tax=Sphingomonas glacialis TaxID=658225 RepID=A0ABQ3LD74_9SPHN|nr:phage portal protein [Sphingomonas glacialis]GHH09331.1 hypothetical protein GCM10008023_05880 [Sphingomonas glacialis]